MELKKELSIIKNLGFEEIKPLLWCKRESKGVLYFDFRGNIVRKSYALGFDDKPIEKQHFEAYSLFKMLSKKNGN